MTIKREDIDRRIVNFSDVVSGHRLPPVYPGEILRDEFLTPMGISVYELANAIKVSRSRAKRSLIGLQMGIHLGVAFLEDRQASLPSMIT